MADTKDNNDNGGGAANATVADLIAQFKAVAPLFAQMQELIAAAGGGAATPAVTPGGDEDPEGEVTPTVTPGAEDEDPAAATEDEDDKEAAAMDAAVAKALAPLRKGLPAATVAAMDAAVAGLGKSVVKGAAARRASSAVGLDAAVAKALAPFQKQLKAAPTVADITAGIARRDALARDLSQHVGTFDHSAMTEAQVAAYGVQSLKLQGVPKGHEVTAVRAALSALPNPQQAARTVTHAMDGADKGGKNMFLTGLSK